MNAPFRAILSLAILMLVLAACGTTAGDPASPSPMPSEPADPSPASETPATPSGEKREVAGTITLAEGMTFSGPGATIQEALDAGPSGDMPTLVNGVLFRDTDGTIYLATSVSDASAPTFDDPMLEVLGLDSDGPDWDMDNAELLGLEEANGIVFNQNAQILGYLELP